MPRPRSFDESAILDRALELFRSRGYEATSIADLEHHLGVGRQSLYNTFGDKHRLFLTALERFLEQAADEGLAALSARNAGLEAIRAHFERTIAALTPRAEERKSCFVASSALELAGHCEATRARCAAADRATTAAFRHALGNSQRTGDVRKDVDLDAAATMLTTQLYGLSVLAKLGASRDAMRGAVEQMLQGLA